MPQAPQQREFTDEPFMTAGEKHQILKSWVTFLRHGCRWNHFTQRLYQHLTLHCSFIAHFSCAGFYDFYFGRVSDATIRFLDQFDPKLRGISAEYGATYWLKGPTGADLNHAMRVTAGEYVDKLRLHFKEARMRDDLSLASQHAARYDLRLTTDDGASALADNESAGDALTTSAQLSLGCDHETAMQLDRPLALPK